jgi:hypothetical protein
MNPLKTKYISPLTAFPKTGVCLQFFGGFGGSLEPIDQRRRLDAQGFQCAVSPGRDLVPAVEPVGIHGKMRNL